jgi:transcriptional regulator with XRE-family HTH domain
MSVQVNKLRAAREARGMTRAEAARRAQVPYEALVRLETVPLPLMVGEVVSDASSAA